MRKIALLGGLGPESTILYYRGIIDAFVPRYDQLGYPEVIIDNVDLKRVLAMANENLWSELAQEFAHRFEVMRDAGAEIGAMASNTPHKIFDEIQNNTKLPLLSIVKATCDEARKKNLTRLLLLGTKFTMVSDFYLNQFNQFGIELVVPKNSEQDYIHDKIFKEIEHGELLADTRQRMLDIIDNHRDKILDGVIFGCTELPLLIHKDNIDLYYLNTTQLHIDAIVRACFDERQEK